MSNKQSIADRLERLNRGCCPVHGLFMSQTDGWFYPSDEKPYATVGCPRRGCPARAKAQSFEGPWELLPICSFLLDNILDLSRLPSAKTSRRAKTVPSARQLLAKTGGVCFYCGARLNPAVNYTVDHIVPQVNGGDDALDNLVPACRSCNSTKGSKDIEQFRFHRAMQRFYQKTGIWFASHQVEYLESIGMKLEIPEHVFWFEIRDA